MGYNLPLAVNGTVDCQKISKNLQGKKIHVLSFLGDNWGVGEPRFPDDLAIGYTKYLIEKGGIITWDIRINLDGSISASFVRQLKLINQAIYSNIF